MFFSTLIAPVLLATLAIAKPIAIRRSEAATSLSRKDISPISFDNYQGIQSLKGFDEFNGVGNFNGRNNKQQVVIQEQTVVCQSVSARIIQQQLAIVQELTKRILSQQICEVETQTIILQQFRSGLAVFQSDIIRQTGRQVGFDKQIAALIAQLINGDGSINSKDFGFSGSDVGSQTVIVLGSNWDDNTGAGRVKAAQDAAKKAAAGAKASKASTASKSASSASSTVKSASSASSTVSSAAASSTSAAASSASETASSSASSSAAAEETKSA